MITGDYWLGAAEETSDNVSDQRWDSGAPIVVTGRGPNGNDLDIILNEDYQHCLKLGINSATAHDVQDKRCTGDSYRALCSDAAACSETPGTERQVQYALSFSLRNRNSGNASNMGVVKI